MAKLRRDTHSDTQYFPPAVKPLRIVASGTLFLTHTFSLPSHPTPSSVVRAHSVEKARGGPASTVLSLLAQFPAVEAALVAPLGGNDEGQMIIRDLENEGVLTRYCKVWKGAGVPSAWVLNGAESGTRTVINHNPLPDITHEDFVSLLGPLLAPENFPSISPTITPITPAQTPCPAPGSSSATPRPSQSGPHPSPVLVNPNSPAPFDWLHFEGRSVKTTLSNITGLDGLARERKWRSHCVFSIDVGRRGRQGVEALIPHADVIFLNKHYAQASAPHYATTPRAFLLSLVPLVPPHALLVAYWGTEGAAVLSLPTKEYFQSSGWVEEKPPPIPNGRGAAQPNAHGATNTTEVQSVRSGSDFWAGPRSRTPSSSAFTAGESRYMAFSDIGNDSGMGHSPMNSFSRSQSHSHDVRNSNYTEEDDNDSQGTEMPGGDNDDDVIDKVGAQDAFIAGMIYALSRRIMPGLPYTPAWAGEEADSKEADKGRWRLDECLRFATELAGRKARRRTWTGLSAEMTAAGWFEV
ncbi:hypothetical protein BDQ17DRAFT_467964 [Cyathus striatus]|nr:hypothetical protein BDQ17DRAFT_467964 [Cyathus striatus]